MMLFPLRQIFTGFMPNMSLRDIYLACSYMCFPWRWMKLQQGKYILLVEKKLREFFGVPYALTVDSGRTALLYSLRSVGVEEGDEVLVQAYTCLVVINAIRFAGATPVYVDIAEDYNMDPRDMEKKITNKTKAVIVQHTFGHPANMDSLLDIARRHRLKTVEDCAHSFGVKHKGRYTGTFADAAIFSFGGEKVVSCVRGGAMITSDPEVYAKMKMFCDRLGPLPRMEIIRHLLKFPIFAMAKPLYRLRIGKWLLALSARLGWTSKILSTQEKRGVRALEYPSTFSSALAHIVLGHIEQVGVIAQGRMAIAEQYGRALKDTAAVQLPVQTKDTKFLRYTIRVPERSALVARAKKRGIMLGQWYKQVVDPFLGDHGYRLGSCPVAEKVAAESVNLPIHRGMTRRDVSRVLSLFVRS